MAIRPETRPTPSDPSRIRRIVRDFIAPTPTAGLPGRVRERIAKREDDAEILVRLFQLAIIVLFGALYFVSPKTDFGTPFALAPSVIGAYLAITLLGLAWALRASLPDWAVYASIVVDLALLFTLIWSFHVQYEQPPSFYLKAPTLLYVFIFIALRALRFRARFVIATGVLAALGWVGMFGYAIAHGPMGEMITRDYVAYMTGNQVLIGAEIDKIASILTVTAILAIVLRRGRRELVQAVAEEAAARDLSRFFDSSVASRIRLAESEVTAGTGVQRQAAIAYVDIRGFSRIAETVEPGQAIRLLAEYQARLVPVVEAAGGAIDKFLGDGIMATFGAAAESETYAADALRAIDAVLDEAARWAGEREREGRLPPIAVTAGAAAGAVIFGAVGDASRLEYTVIGAPVNLAAKLDKHNKALGTRALVSAALFDAALAQGYRPSRECPRHAEPIEGIDGKVELVVFRS